MLYGSIEFDLAFLSIKVQLAPSATAPSAAAIARAVSFNDYLASSGVARSINSSVAKLP
jgi:hypothetical protein